jgi:tetratricopeptide (TPR) repeat protein
VNKNNILYGIIGLFAGLVISFLVTNALDHGVRDPARTEAADSGTQETANKTKAQGSAEDSSATVSEEEIRGAIAKADARADDVALQRNFGLALYQYSQQAQETRYLPDIARFLKRAYDANPKDHDLTLSLANVFFDIGQSSDPTGFIQARNYYLKALELKPDDASAHTGLGQTYYFGKPSDPQRAIAEYRKSLAIDPRHEPALQNLASALITTGRGEEAQQRIDELQKLNPSNRALANLRAQLAQSRNASAQE